MNRRESLKLGASIIAGMAIAPTVLASENAVDGEKSAESFLNVIKHRRAVRNFKPDPIPEEHLINIVDAARMAPCAGNEQAWKFIIVQDKTVIEELRAEWISYIERDFKKGSLLSEVELKNAIQKRIDEWIAGRLSAPAYIVILTDEQRKWPDYNRHDGPLAAGYLLLAARAYGYGSVYLTDSIPDEVTKKVFRIPDRYTRVCITPIGVPVDWPKQQKKDLKEFIIKDRF